MTVINDVANKIVFAIQAIYEPSTSNNQRIELTKSLDELKDNEDHIKSISLAFNDLVTHQDFRVQLYGWNIIEHIIKYKWNDLSLEARIFIRDRCLGFLGQESLLNKVDDTSVRIALTRSIVVMIEQEWPQHWPDLIPQFETIVKETTLIVPCQTVFIVLRRLIEDVKTIENIEDPGRKKDLTEALVASMKQIFDMTIFRLRHTVAQGIGNSNKLVKAGLELLTGSLEWVTGPALEDIDSIIDVLCSYLRLPDFGFYELAAECLYKIAARTRTTQSEAPIVVSLFRDEPIQTILLATNSLFNTTDPDQYHLLKTLGDFLGALGTHLAEVWSHIKHPPSNFALYLTAIVGLFKHPSVYVRAEMTQCLITFVKHDQISKSDEFARCIVEILPIIPINMERVGSLTDKSPTSHYSQLDYDDDLEFQHDYIQLRDRLLRLTCESSRTHFMQIVGIMVDWINRAVTQPAAVRTTEWEAMKKFIKELLKFSYASNLVPPEIEQSLLVLFDSIITRLSSMADDPKIINELLSVATALFSIFDNHPDRIAGMLALIKKFLMLENPNNKDQGLLDIKRHSISLLLNLVANYTKFIQPYAQDVLNLVIETVNKVSTMQKVQLVQVLASLSNLANSLDEQRNFLHSAIHDNIEFLQSDEFSSAIASCDSFLVYIGLSLPAPRTDAEAQETLQFQNRLMLKANLQTICGVMTSVHVVEDRQNPLFSLISPMLPNIFQLIRCLFGLHRPEVTALIHLSYGPIVLDITHADKASIATALKLNGVDQQAQQSHAPLNSVDHLRRFITDLHEVLFSIVGLLGSKCAQEFYATSASADLLNLTLESIEYLHDFRLRFWLRKAWKPLVCSCPADHSSRIIQFLIVFGAHLSQIISKRWEAVSGASDEPTDEELFMENMTTVFSREVVHFYRTLAFGEAVDHKSSGNLIPLASVVFADQRIFEKTIENLCHLVTCKDTQTATKAVSVARALVNQYRDMFTEDMAKYLFYCSIRSLMVHGADELGQGFALTMIYNVYSGLRSKYPSICALLHEVPGANEQTIGDFDRKIGGTGATNGKNVVPEKIRREITRKFFKTLIPKKLGEVGKRPKRFRPLPPIQKDPKMVVEDNDESLYSLANLFE